MANTPVLTTTRYVRPGAYIGRIIQPDPTTTGFVRTPCYVGKGNRLQTLFDQPIQRSYISGQALTFSTIAPNIAPLTYPAVNDQTKAVLVDQNGQPVPQSQWKFIESVPSSKVFDQVLMDPTAFNINSSYTINYQSTSRTFKDPMPSGITALRLMRAVGNSQGQSLYVEGTDYIVNNTMTAPAPDAANAHLTPGFSAVLKVRGAYDTGSITMAVTAAYTHPYNRTYTLRCTNIALTVYTFQWESIEDSAGRSMLPRVPAGSAVAAPTFTVDTSIVNPTTVSLSHHLLGGDLGVQVTINPTAGGAISVGDVWQFRALGAGLIEADSAYDNTNQFSQIGTPVATLQGGSTGACTIYDYSEYTGTSDRTYSIEAVSVAGVSPNRTANFAWQGYGDTGITTGTIAISEATGTNLNVTLEAGIKLNFSFGAGQFVVTAGPNGPVGDRFVISALAPRRNIVAKDDRAYKISVSTASSGHSTSATAAALNLFYQSGTIEGGYNSLAVLASTASRSWAIVMANLLSAVTPDPLNTGVGVLTAVGTPTDSFNFVVKVIATGAPGAATLQVSQDGGATFGATFTSPAVASSYLIPGTGISISCAGVFTANDLYHFNCTAAAYPTMSSGAFTLPGDFVMWARNIGADVTPDLKQNRFVAADLFTFSFTDLLTIDWTLEQRATETFNSTQIFTDALGTVTGVAGRKYIVLSHAPTSIQYVHNSPSGTALSYLSIAGTPYVTFPTEPAGAVSILYTWMGSEPAPGNFYYITVDVVRQADQYNKVITARNLDEANRLLGPLSPENDLQIMAGIAFEAFAPQIQFVQVKDANGDGVFSDQDYKDAIAATEKNSTLTDVVVLNRFSVLQNALASNEAMNDPFQRKERMLWVGAPAGTTIGSAQDPGTLVALARVTLQVYGQNQAHGRRVLLGNTFGSRTITLGDGSSVAVNLDGSFIAGMAAAKNASFTDPGTLLLRTNGVGFDNSLTPTVPAMQTYGEEEELDLGGASILYLSNQGSLTAPVFRFEESVTVDTSSSDNNEISAQNQQFFVTRDIRSRIDTASIGFVPPSQQAGVAFLKSQLATNLMEYVARGIIAPYTNDDGSDRPIDPSNDLVVFRDKTDKTLYYIMYWYNLRYGVKRVFGMYSVDRRLFGAQAA